MHIFVKTEKFQIDFNDDCWSVGKENIYYSKCSTLKISLHRQGVSFVETWVDGHAFKELAA